MSQALVNDLGRTIKLVQGNSGIHQELLSAAKEFASHESTINKTDQVCFALFDQLIAGLRNRQAAFNQSAFLAEKFISSQFPGCFRNYSW